MTALRVVLNGEDTELPAEITVTALLERLELTGRACAVEVNRAVVPKSTHAEHVLREGDRIEIVTFVGGG